MDAESVQETLESFTLTTYISLMIKLTTITYLCEIFNPNP